MSLINTNTGRTVFKNAESLMMVPYVYNSTYGDYVLGSDVYDLSAIIGDSIVIEQQDGDTVVKNNEFVASPLVECVSGAKYGFTAQCIDLQNKVLKSCFSVMTVTGIDNLAAFNDDHVLRYAMIRIRFRDESLPDVILPKVQLNSKLLINQLKTRVSQGNIVGTAKSAYIVVPGQSTTSALQFNKPEGGTTYTPYTPVLFVPKDKSILFFHHQGSGTTDSYSSVNFTTGTVEQNASVNKSTGSITYVQPS